MQHPERPSPTSLRRATEPSGLTATASRPSTFNWATRSPTVADGDAATAEQPSDSSATTADSSSALASTSLPPCQGVRDASPDGERAASLLDGRPTRRDFTLGASGTVRVGPPRPDDYRLDVERPHRTHRRHTAMYSRKRAANPSLGLVVAPRRDDLYVSKKRRRRKPQPRSRDVVDSSLGIGPRNHGRGDETERARWPVT